MPCTSSTGVQSKHIFIEVCQLAFAIIFRFDDGMEFCVYYKNVFVGGFAISSMIHVFHLIKNFALQAKEMTAERRQINVALTSASGFLTGLLFLQTQRPCRGLQPVRDQCLVQLD